MKLEDKIRVKLVEFAGEWGDFVYISHSIGEDGSHITEKFLKKIMKTLTLHNQKGGR